MLMNTIAHTLSQFHVFSELGDRALQELSLHIHERSFASGQLITLTNELCRAVYLIVEGGVRTQRLSLEGREYVLDYLGPGEFFDLVPVLDGKPNVYTAEALADAKVYVIPSEHFLQLVRDHKPVAMAALEHLATRVRTLSDKVEELALHTVRTRLARFLLSHSDDGTPRPIRQWTQEEIANHIGTVRDVVGRTLRIFAREGFIRRERGRLIVIDQPALQHEALSE
jgi:CRP/FNR family transcriptional regulator